MSEAQRTAKRKMYTHMGSTHEVSYPHLTDTEIAHKVRMLMRTDLDHEAVVVGARDRLLYLIDREQELLAALDKAAKWFEDYAVEHYAKARTAPDGREQHGCETKGKLNAGRAKELRTVIANAKGGAK